MGSASSHAGADEKPVHLVQLGGYCVDVDEVSVQDFATWLNTDKRTPEGSDIRSLTKTKDGWSAEEDRNAHPAEGVTWKEANDYCNAKGQSLPTVKPNGKRPHAVDVNWVRTQACVILQTYEPIHGAQMPPLVELGKSSTVRIWIAQTLCFKHAASK